MSLFTRSLWPDRVRHPYLRLAAAMVIAPAVLIAIGAAIAFVIAGASESTEVGTMAVTIDSAIALAALAAVLMVVAGIPGVATLWAAGQRGVLAWSIAGTGLGALTSAVLSYLQQGMVTELALTIGTVFCCLLFLLIRAIAGIRTR